MKFVNKLFYKLTRYNNNQKFKIYKFFFLLFLIYVENFQVLKVLKFLKIGITVSFKKIECYF